LTIKFSEGKLEGDGRTLTVKHVRTLSRSSIGKCPHLIMVPGHYRADESCRCDDPSHTEMSEWGYAWNGKLWNGEGTH